MWFKPLIFVVFLTTSLGTEDNSGQPRGNYDGLKVKLGKSLDEAKQLHRSPAKSGKVDQIAEEVATTGLHISDPIGAVYAGVKVVLEQASGPQSQPDVEEIKSKLSQIGEEVSKAHQQVEEGSSNEETRLYIPELLQTEAELQLLQVLYQRLLDENNEKVKADFLETCSDIAEKPSLLAQLVSPGAYKYGEQVKAQNSEPLYVEFIRNVEGLLFQATILESACNSAKYQNSPEEERAKKQEEIEKRSKLYFSQIALTVQADSSHFIFQAVRHMVEGYGSKNSGQSNADFGKGLFNLINSSFPNGHFFLAVYGNQKTEKGKRHTHYPQKKNQEVKLDTKPEESYFYFWKHAWNRNIVLIRQGTKVVDHSRKAVFEACADRPALGYVGCGWKKCNAIDCSKWAKETSDCLSSGKESYVALGCFHGDNFRAATFNYGYVTREGSITTVSPHIPHAQYIVY